MTILLVSLYYPVPSSVHFDHRTSESPRRLVELVLLSGPKASRLIAVISVQSVIPCLKKLCQNVCSNVLLQRVCDIVFSRLLVALLLSLLFMW